MRSHESVASSSPVAALVATTKEARRALDAPHEVRVMTFPFKVGRESRVAAPADPALIELRLGASPQLNDVYLVEPTWADVLQISREHFPIEHADNQFFLADRGSACGTIVAGTRIGGHQKGGRTELRDGDEVIVGTNKSPYVFRFEIVPE